MRVFLALPTYNDTLYVNTFFSALHAVQQPSKVEVSIEHASGSLLPRVFNRLLATAAIRGYERFCMMHADICAAPGWLDVMLKIMDEHDADVLSAIAPIKDARGLTSTAIYDKHDTLRILTLEECHTRLPGTFDVSAEYLQSLQASVLAVNTGLMLMRLDREWLRQWPGFQIRSCIKWSSDEVVVDVTSEDWDMSQALAKLTPRPKVMATRAVQLHHRGAHLWASHPVAPAAVSDGKLGALSLVQIIEFELGSECNLGKAHDRCPNQHPDRYAGLDTSRELDDETITRTAVEAYRDLGFTGTIGWIYYNEPLLQAERMFRLMGEIKAQVPEARFMLWTNGMLIPEECEGYRQFEQIIISGYNELSQRGYERLSAHKIPCRFIRNCKLDGRLVNVKPTSLSTPCLRPFVEFIIDNYGNTHPCCYDWHGQGTWGNIHDVPLSVLADRWRGMLVHVAGVEMKPEAPAVCQDCGNRWSRIQQFDDTIIARAHAWRAAQSPM